VTTPANLPPGKAAAEFAERVLETAAEASQRAGATSWIALGALPAELKFASDDLHRLFAPSFSQLIAPQSAPAMSVALWAPQPDIAPIPPLPWPAEAYRACGEIAGYSEGRYYIRLEVPMEALIVFDVQSGRAAYLNRSPHLLPTHEWVGPLRWLIHRLAVEHQMVFAHAAAVARSGRAAVIAGARGAGKSTTTLACFAAGFDYFGDDRCLLSAGSRPRVFSVYSSAKVLAAEADRFTISGLDRFAVPPQLNDDGKILVPINRIAPERLGVVADIGCILIPKRAGEVKSRLRRATPAEAIRILIAEIVGQSPVTAARSLALVTQICRELPIFVLEAGTDLRDLADTVERALEMR
jgi:hypothetical protein